MNKGMGKMIANHLQNRKKYKKFVANDVYGYIMITTLSMMISALGVVIIFREKYKKLENREPLLLLLGICISIIGSVILLLTVLYIKTRRT